MLIKEPKIIKQDPIAGMRIIPPLHELLVMGVKETPKT